MTQTDEFYMRRCLRLARQGRLNAKPNPMVGAVIVAPDGRVIGEGYHVRCGEGHAEVNAFASVSAADEALLRQSTMYVSLEPCSHQGRTPPCADLIVRRGVPRVVAGCVDPFPAVSGRGIERLRAAGVEVTTGVLESECLELNRRFITYNLLHRPYVTLKWCRSADGYIDDHFGPFTLSTPFTLALSHRLRAETDAILVGRVTDERDRPRLDTRLWPGPSPLRITLDRGQPFDPSIDFGQPVIPQLMSYLYDRGAQTLLVEGGAETHRRFLSEADCWDEIRVETAPIVIGDGTKAPELPSGLRLKSRVEHDGNVIETYVRRHPQWLEAVFAARD